MLRTVLGLSVIVFVFVESSTARKLPSYIHTCSRSDPQLNECVLREVDVVRPHLKDGIPEMHLPTLEPMFIEYGNLDSGHSFNASFSNIKIYGLSNFKVDNLKIDLDNPRIDVDATFPYLRVAAIYDISGRILILQLNGHGNADGNYTNTRASAVVTGQKVLKKGKEYINFDDCKVEVYFGKVTLHFDDIFQGNEQLTEQTNKVINENVLDFIEEVKPVAIKTISTILLALIKGSFERFSLDELFRP